jgi:hypothetical protein
MISSTLAWTLGQLGPVLSGISLLIGAIVAWYVYFKFNRKDLYQRWVDSFRVLYEEFWSNEEMGTIRMWIVSDQLYSTNLEQVLIRRNGQPDNHNNLDANDNKVLNSLDRFCSLMVRAQSFASDRQNMRHLTPEQRALWSKLLYTGFWAGRGRTELEKYVAKQWPELRTDAVRYGKNWVWVLAIPLLFTLWVPFWYSTAPTFFYWYQIIWIIISFVLVAVGYFKTVR